MLVRIRPLSSEDVRPSKCALCILGSTGSIGLSALEVIRTHRSHFEVVSLVAATNVKVLAAQVLEFQPQFVSVKSDVERTQLSELLPSFPRANILLGIEGACQLAADPQVSHVLAAMVGVVGLRPVLTALENGKTVALANKESLVAGGKLVAQALQKNGQAEIVPVDSEHSAIFQALRGHVEQSQGQNRQIDSITLTASGGPFRSLSLSELEAVTPQQATQHPRWKMGPKISVDSATMANKALELIEAHWLFGISSEKIKVVIHPQSIVHSLVEFVDHSSLAQLSVADMKGPISYALRYPQSRLPGVMKSLDLAAIGQLEFFPLDDARFPLVKLARSCLSSGSAASAVFNLANELAVAEFLRLGLGFNQIPKLVDSVLQEYASYGYQTIEDLLGIGQEIELKFKDRFWLKKMSAK